MKKVLGMIAGAVIIIAILSAFLYGRKVGRNGQETVIKTKVDTLFIRDTIVQIEPVSVTKTIVKKDTIAVTDTLTLRDTLFVFLEREQIRWEDSLAVVYASGVNPQVDSVIHYTNDRIITIETVKTIKEKSKWGLGIQAGVGLGIQAGVGLGMKGVSPYVGIGVNYNILSW